MRLKIQSRVVTLTNLSPLDGTFNLHKIAKNSLVRAHRPRSAEIIPTGPDPPAKFWLHIPHKEFSLNEKIVQLMIAMLMGWVSMQMCLGLKSLRHLVCVPIDHRSSIMRPMHFAWPSHRKGFKVPIEP